MGHAEIIDGLGGSGAVASALGVPGGTAWRWRDRNRIPVHHWDGILAMARSVPAMAHITGDTLRAGWCSEKGAAA